jgi:hypothetical protein
MLLKLHRASYCARMGMLVTIDVIRTLSEHCTNYVVGVELNYSDIL